MRGAEGSLMELVLPFHPYRMQGLNSGSQTSWGKRDLFWPTAQGAQSTLKGWSWSQLLSVVHKAVCWYLVRPGNFVYKTEKQYDPLATVERVVRQQCISKGNFYSHWTATIFLILFGHLLSKLPLRFISESQAIHRIGWTLLINFHRHTEPWATKHPPPFRWHLPGSPNDKSHCSLCSVPPIS